MLAHFCGFDMVVLFSASSSLVLFIMNLGDSQMCCIGYICASLTCNT
jgi:hypothetical protein